jgi:hypothetical protein
VDAHVEQRIAAAPIEQIDLWTVRILSAATLAEVFAGKRDLSWSPTGDQIAVFVRKENRRDLAIFDAMKGGLVKRMRLDGIARWLQEAGIK